MNIATWATGSYSRSRFTNERMALKVGDQSFITITVQRNFRYLHFMPLHHCLFKEQWTEHYLLQGSFVSHYLGKCTQGAEMHSPVGSWIHYALSSIQFRLVHSFPEENEQKVRYNKAVIKRL
jgi:hypothetical protein